MSLTEEALNLATSKSDWSLRVTLKKGNECDVWSYTENVHAADADGATVYSHITTCICIGRMLQNVWRGRQSPRLRLVGDAVRQSTASIFRYTIVYKLYGLFIYSISYVCMYLYEYMYKKKRIIFRSFFTSAGVLF